LSVDHRSDALSTRALPSTIATLDARSCNALVLQERTLLPFEDFDDHLQSVAAITERARSIGARVILQRYWPRARWHKDYAERSALIRETPQIMFSRLLQLTERVSSELSKVMHVLVVLRNEREDAARQQGSERSALSASSAAARQRARRMMIAHFTGPVLSEHLREWAHEALAKH
jgi:hypothetical protein